MNQSSTKTNKALQISGDIVKLLVASSLIVFMLYSYQGPKARHKVYDEVEQKVSQKQSYFASLKSMTCTPKDYSLLHGSNFVRCSVKFLDGRVVAVEQKIDDKINASRMYFGLSRTDEENKKFALNVASHDYEKIENVGSPEFTSIIRSVYSSASVKYNSGEATPSIWN